MSPLHADGSPWPRADVQSGIAIRRAERDKATTYPELVDSPIALLTTLACEVGGRWSQKCQDTISQLSYARARSVASHLRAAYRRALEARWWAMLSCTQQNALAATLHDDSVVLLDEIEKAHPDTFNILLQVLDEGRLTDNKGRVADFKNTIIIMTSNMGSEIIQEKFENSKDNFSAAEAARIEVLGLLKKMIRPEFLNRIDDIIMFTPLNKKDIRKIVKLQLELVKKILSKQQIVLDATDEAIDFLADKGYDPQYGARPVKRTLQKEVLNNMSKALLSGEIKADSVVLLDSFDNALVFRNQNDLVL